MLLHPRRVADDELQRNLYQEKKQLDHERI
jgi:hypothetical protein